MPTQNQRNNRNARSAGTRRSSTGGSTSRNSSGSPRRSAGSASRNQSGTTRRSTGSSRSRNRRKYIIRQRVALLICAVLLCSIIGFAVYKLTRQDTPDNPQGPAQTSGSTTESTEPAAQPESTEAVTEPAPTTEAAGRLEELPRSYKLPVEAVLQNPELPSGCEILAAAKGKSTIPFATSLAKLSELSPQAKRYTQLEARAADVYGLATRCITSSEQEYRAKITLSAPDEQEEQETEE